MSLETCYHCLTLPLSLSRECVWSGTPVWWLSLLSLVPTPIIHGPQGGWSPSQVWGLAFSAQSSGSGLSTSYIIALIDESVAVWISNQQNTYWSSEMNYYQHVCCLTLKTCNMCVPSQSRQFTTPDIQLGREIHIGLVLSNQQFLENFKLTFSFSFH